MFQLTRKAKEVFKFEELINVKEIGQVHIFKKSCLSNHKKVHRKI